MSSRSKSAAAVLAVAAVLFLAACSPVRPAPSHRAPVLPHGSPRLLVGVYEPTAAGSYWQIPQFAAAIGRWPQIVSYYSRWGAPFASGFAAQAERNGGETLVQIDPRGVSLAAIAAGGEDSYLRRFAAEVRAFRHPVIISFGQEMNGSWYPWGWKHVPPAVFVAAWRHIVTLFRRAAVENVTWLWNVNRDGGGTAPLREWWPGRSYVTWVGIDGYYYKRDSTFTRVFGRTIGQVRAFTSAPILLAEVGVGQVAGQAAKIPSIFAGVRRYHLLGLIWFDVAQHAGFYHQDWRLEGNPAALTAFKRGLS